MNNFKKSTVAVVVCGAFASGSAFAATGFIDSNTAGWYFSTTDGTAALVQGDEARDVFMGSGLPNGQGGNNRAPNQTQTLIVDGTDLTGKKISLTHTGTAVVEMKNGATAQFIEGGANFKTTNIDIVLENSSLAAKPGTTIDSGNSIAIAPLDNGVHNITLKNSVLGGGIVTGGTNNVQITDSSVVNGNVTVGGSGDSTVQVVDSSVTGNINGSLVLGNMVVYLDNADIGGSVNTGAGNDAVILANGAVVQGNVSLGGGDDMLLVTGGSTIYGNVNGGGGNDLVGVEKGSTIVGDISNVEMSISLGVLEGSVTDTTVDLTNGSQAAIGNMTDSSIAMSSDSSVTVAGIISGKNDLVVASLAADKPLAASTELAQVTGALAEGATFDMAFANGEQTVKARSGAFVNALDLEQQALGGNFGEGFKVVMNAQQAGLAADVQAHIAGIDAADKLARAVSGNVANRMGALRLSNAQGLQIWGDVFHRAGDVDGDVAYDSKLQGIQTGIDWSGKLAGGDRVNVGAAFAHGANKAEDRGQADFSNKAKGDFVSVYGGWAQSLEQRTWGLFVEGSASFGSLRFSQSSMEVGNATTGAMQSMGSSYDGSSVALEARAGVSFKLAETALVQPYALVGWSKVKTDAFANSAVDFAANSASSTYAGLGVKASRGYVLGNVPVNAWVDASYVKDFGGDKEVRVAEFTLADPLKQKSGALAMGFDAAVTRDLSVGLGLSYGFGDVQGFGAKLGLNYRF